MGDKETEGPGQSGFSNDEGPRHESAQSDKGYFDFSETLSGFESFAREKLVAEIPTEPEINNIWKEIKAMLADHKAWVSTTERLIENITEQNKSVITFIFVETTQHFLQYRQLFDRLKARTMTATEYLHRMETATTERKLLLGQLQRLEKTVNHE